MGERDAAMRPSLLLSNFAPLHISGKQDEMVYLEQTTAAQRAWFPVAPARIAGTPVLALRNTTDHTACSVPATIGGDFSSDFNGDFDRPARGSVRLTFSLPEGLAVGEYEYHLLDGDVTLSIGLAWIGELGNADEYDHPVEFDQYDD